MLPEDAKEKKYYMDRFDDVMRNLNSALYILRNEVHKELEQILDYLDADWKVTKEENND